MGDPFDPRWFGHKVGVGKVLGGHVVLAQAHRRMSASADHAQGIGLLQFGTRHLLYVGHRSDSGAHVCLGFVWLTKGRP